MCKRSGFTILFAAALFNALAVEPGVNREFPFQFHDGLIWLKVRVPQFAEPLNLLLDSGAEVSVLNLGTAQKLGLKLGRRVRVQGVQTDAEGYWPEHWSASLADVALPRDYLAVNLGSLSQACECAIDGLLGADFFREHVVQIDFTARKIRLLTSAERQVNDEALPLRTRRGVLAVPIRINHHKPVWVRLDTGCASAVHWVTADVCPETCTRRMAVGLADVPALVTPTTVRLGITTFESVPTEVHQEEIFSGESGLLGNGLLSRFSSVTIDVRAGRVLLDPGPRL